MSALHERVQATRVCLRVQAATRVQGYKSYLKSCLRASECRARPAKRRRHQHFEMRTIIAERPRALPFAWCAIHSFLRGRQAEMELELSELGEQSPHTEPCQRHMPRKQPGMAHLPRDDFLHKRRRSGQNRHSAEDSLELIVVSHRPPTQLQQEKLSLPPTVWPRDGSRPPMSTLHCAAAGVSRYLRVTNPRLPEMMPLSVPASWSLWARPARHTSGRHTT